MFVEPVDECFGGLFALFAAKAVAGAGHDDQFALNAVLFERGINAFAVVEFHEVIFVAVDE